MGVHYLTTFIMENKGVYSVEVDTELEDTESRNH